MRQMSEQEKADRMGARSVFERMSNQELDVYLSQNMNWHNKEMKRESAHKAEMLARQAKIRRERGY